MAEKKITCMQQLKIFRSTVCIHVLYYNIIVAHVHVTIDILTTLDGLI